MGGGGNVLALATPPQNEACIRFALTQGPKRPKGQDTLHARAFVQRLAEACSDAAQIGRRSATVPPRLHSWAKSGRSCRRQTWARRAKADWRTCAPCSAITKTCWVTGFEIASPLRVPPEVRFSCRERGLVARWDKDVRGSGQRGQHLWRNIRGTRWVAPRGSTHSLTASILRRAATNSPLRAMISSSTATACKLSPKRGRLAPSCAGRPRGARKGSNLWLSRRMAVSSQLAMVIPSPWNLARMETTPHQRVTLSDRR